MAEPSQKLNQHMPQIARKEADAAIQALTTLRFRQHNKWIFTLFEKERPSHTIQFSTDELYVGLDRVADFVRDGVWVLDTIERGASTGGMND